MGPVAALATARVHVLVVAMPGHALLRIRAESAARRRGWPLVDEPEQADLLVVCGAPTRLSGDAAERAWARVRAPRALRRIRVQGDIEPAFDSAARVLGDRDLQRAERAARPAPQEVAEPDGVLRLGPLGRGWPGGLLVTARIERGRIAAARLRLEVVPAESDELEDDDREAALMLDRAASVLRLAGLRSGALEAERLLDGVLRRDARTRLLRRARRLRRRTARSATLPLALRPAARDGLLDALLRAERALWGMAVPSEAPSAADFVAALTSCTPLEAVQWAASSGRPELRRAVDG